MEKSQLKEFALQLLIMLLYPSFKKCDKEISRHWTNNPHSKTL